MYSVLAPDFLILFNEKKECPKESLSYFEADTHVYPRVLPEKIHGYGLGSVCL